MIQIPTQLDISDLLKALSDESDDALGWRDITELRKPIETIQVFSIHLNILQTINMKKTFIVEPDL